ncbi:hypothetical protein HVIM_03935 (plasmid) [Roseomonas mucosa]|nr:hypothetical protein HVIM_03935 [Roseomonas mucosa]
MGWVWMVAIVAGLATLGALALRAKLKRDAILQDGQVVGSALYGGVVSDEEALFVMLRGEPTFRADIPFEHDGHRYLLLSHEAYDDHSPVLRRFINARCRVMG